MLGKTACVFTGHRELNEKFNIAALDEAIERFINDGVEKFYCGMALGFDLLAAERVIQLKSKYPRVQLIACIPCANQSEKYSPFQQKRYFEILKKCDEEICLSEFYFKGCMHARNLYMVDHSNCMIAYIKKEEGGTAFTVDLFQRKKPQCEVCFVGDFE